MYYLTLNGRAVTRPGYLTFSGAVTAARAYALRYRLKPPVGVYFNSPVSGPVLGATVSYRPPGGRNAKPVTATRYRYGMRYYHPVLAN